MFKGTKEKDNTKAPLLLVEKESFTGITWSPRACGAPAGEAESKAICSWKYSAIFLGRQQDLNGPFSFLKFLTLFNHMKPPLKPGTRAI